LIREYDSERFGGLADRIKIHDRSKFEDPEIEPYIYITWMYKCQADGVEFTVPEEIKAQMNEATEHHIKANRHHPEYHCDKTENLINTGNRDAVPDGAEEDIIDGSKMLDLDVAEMVADWCAVSAERGTHPKDWADMNIDKRWRFTEPHRKLIYELIEEVF
jgi:hypothetical protein